MAQVYYEQDIDLDVIRSRRIAIVGYGNQGRAQALNLRDSGCDVRVAARPGGHSGVAATRDGFPTASLSEVVAESNVISLLLPDQVHRDVFVRSIGPHLRPESLLLVAHGFSVHYGQVQAPPNVDVALVAPVGPGTMVRRLFLEGGGVPGLFAVHQDASGQAEQIALSYAAALGCARIGVQRTTFAEETETDLFGEQAVLCGGLPALMVAGFDTLVNAGYQPELAYFECVHQVKLIVDLIYDQGIAGMRTAISDTARYGSYLAGPAIVDDHVRASLLEVLAFIQDGSFAKKWIAETEKGMQDLRRMKADERGELVEQVGSRLRESARAAR